MSQLNRFKNESLLIISVLALSLLVAPMGTTKETLKRDQEKSAPKNIVKVESKQPTTTSSTITTGSTTIQPVDVSQNNHLSLDQTTVSPATVTVQESSHLAGEQINWWVISSGSTDGSSTNYNLLGSIGQVAVGTATSTNYVIKHGFWQNFDGGGCCINNRGNANNDPGDFSNIADITFLVSYLFGIPSGPSPVCQEEANANSDPGELANIADITFLVSYLFGIPSGPAPGACP